MSTDTLRKASNPWLVLAIVCLAQFMVVLDSTVVNVALPTLQTELDFSSSSLPWVINAYTLMFGGFLLLGGRAADLFGRRRLFLAGVDRLHRGVAARRPRAVGQHADRRPRPAGPRRRAGLARRALDRHHHLRRRPPRTKAMGVWAAIAVGGAALGLLLGGILTEYASWRWIFFVNIPIGFVTYLLARRFVPESRVTEHSRLRSRRRRHRHRRADPARHRHRQGAGLRLGLVRDVRVPRRGSPLLLGVVRRDRAAHRATR